MEDGKVGNPDYFGQSTVSRFGVPKFINKGIKAPNIPPYYTEQLLSGKKDILSLYFVVVEPMFENNLYIDLNIDGSDYLGSRFFSEDPYFYQYTYDFMFEPKYRSYPAAIFSVGLKGPTQISLNLDFTIHTDMLGEADITITCAYADII